MPKCKNDNKRSYVGTEPSPKGLGYCAHAEKLNAVKKGKDGNMWIVTNVNGHNKWSKHNKNIKNDDQNKKQTNKSNNNDSIQTTILSDCKNFKVTVDLSTLHGDQYCEIDDDLNLYLKMKSKHVKYYNNKEIQIKLSKNNTDCQISNNFVLLVFIYDKLAYIITFYHNKSHKELINKIGKLQNKTIETIALSKTNQKYLVLNYI